jgi:flagellar motor switch protein FliN/FliY
MRSPKDSTIDSLPPRLRALLDVNLEVTVELGRTRMTLEKVLSLDQGSIVELQKFAGEPLDVLLNGQPVARGEAVVSGDRFGVRLTDILSPDERLRRAL